MLMAIAKMKTENFEDILDAKKIMTIISEYAEGGAKYILEIRQTPGLNEKFNFTDDYFYELLERSEIKTS
jgi:hypothetical protein